VWCFTAIVPARQTVALGGYLPSHAFAIPAGEDIADLLHPIMIIAHRLKTSSTSPGQGPMHRLPNLTSTGVARIESIERSAASRSERNTQRRLNGDQTNHGRQLMAVTMRCIARFTQHPGTRKLADRALETGTGPNAAILVL
jgi:hypothetical protein